VTQQPLNAGAANFIGDYAGIAAAGGYAHPVWNTGHVDGDALGGGFLQTATLKLPAKITATTVGADSAATVSADSLAPQRLSAESALAMILAGGHDGGSFLSPYLTGVLASAQAPAATLSIAGAAGQAHGFTVSGGGLGADSLNVGADGAAVGVANKTTRNGYGLLEAVNQQAVNGGLYNGDTTLQKEADDLFDALTKAGAIS
jgi:hypothetical protein